MPHSLQQLSVLQSGGRRYESPASRKPVPRDYQTLGTEEDETARGTGRRHSYHDGSLEDLLDHFASYNSVAVQ